MILFQALIERPKRANKNRKYKEWEEDEVSEEMKNQGRKTKMILRMKK